MFTAIVRFPHIPAESEGDLREWFAWSNDQLRDAVGLQGRRLLRSDDGAYVALVEHESAASFRQMHASPAAEQVQLRLHQVLDDGPRAEMYEVVEGSDLGDCCGGHRGHHDATTTDRRAEFGS